MKKFFFFLQLVWVVYCTYYLFSGDTHKMAFLALLIVLFDIEVKTLLKWYRKAFKKKKRERVVGYDQATAT